MKGHNSFYCITDGYIQYIFVAYGTSEKGTRKGKETKGKVGEKMNVKKRNKCCISLKLKLVFCL